MWGYSKQVVKVDEEKFVMTIENKTIVSASVQNDMLSVTWEDGDWKSWAELHESQEFRNLVEKVNAKLKDAAVRRCKGVGKGKGAAEMLTE